MNEEEVITVEWELYYWSVILFIECIQDIVTIKKAIMICANLNTCLCDAVLMWYTSELFNLKWIEIQSDFNEVKKWCCVLRNQFKELTAVVLHNLTFMKYIMTDAQSHWEFSVYVQIIICHVKAANLKSVKNQLTFMYQNILSDLRAFVNPSKDIIIITEFIQVLKLKKNMWWEMTANCSQCNDQAN